MSEATQPTGPDLARRRHHLGLSVERVARQAGFTSPNTLRRIEAGDLDDVPSYVGRVAAALDELEAKMTQTKGAA